VQIDLEARRTDRVIGSHTIIRAPEIATAPYSPDGRDNKSTYKSYLVRHRELRRARNAILFKFASCRLLMRAKFPKRPSGEPIPRTEDLPDHVPPITSFCENRSSSFPRVTSYLDVRAVPSAPSGASRTLAFELEVCPGDPTKG
jgi:hypothetical protein